MIRTAGYYSAVLLGLALLAFWPNYLSKPSQADGYTHLHAVGGVLWLALLVAQPLAIRHERRALHRALGRSTYLFAPWFFVSGILLAHHRFAAMAEPKFHANAFTLYLPVHTALLFALCYGLGLYHRRNIAAHSRFMVFTALPLIDPVLARIMGMYFPPLQNEWLYQVITYTITDAVAIALAASYRGVRSARTALTATVGAFILAHLLWFTLARSGAWLAFASWFRSLPLT